MARNKITVQRGTTHAIVVTYYVNGVATDITGSTVLFTVKDVESDEVVADTTALISKSVTSHSDPTAGESTITLTPSDTRTVPAGEYFYDVKIDLDSDDVTVYELVEGTFILDGAPTNRAAV